MSATCFVILAISGLNFNAGQKAICWIVVLEAEPSRSATIS
jgi:hypothetical protein